MNRELLTELGCRKKVQGGWRQGQATWEDDRDIACVCWVGDQKAKVKWQLALTRDVRGQKTSV